MLSARELESSPLFRNITYEEYRRMLTCFQAVQKSYLTEELVYDFSASRADAIGIVERGSVSLIRIDEEGVSTVLEEMGPGGVFGRDLAFAGSAGDSLEVVAGRPAIFCSSIIPTCSAGAKMPVRIIVFWCRTCWAFSATRPRPSASGWMCCPGGLSGRSCCAISGSWRKKAAAIPLPCPFPSACWRTISPRTAAP